jgi:hypothetical protein
VGGLPRSPRQHHRQAGSMNATIYTAQVVQPGLYI